jgi:hypothetical protein
VPEQLVRHARITQEADHQQLLGGQGQAGRGVDVAVQVEAERRERGERKGREKKRCRA